MPKLRIFFIISLLILGALIAVVVFRPMLSGEESSEVQRAQLLEKEEQWILEFDIINKEGEDKNYTINVLVDGDLYSESVSIPDERTFTYIHHIYRDKITEGNLSFTVYREGESTPVEQATYYLK